MVKPRNAAEARDLDTLIADARNQMYFDKTISTYRMCQGYELGRRHPNDREHMGDAIRRLGVAAQKTADTMRGLFLEVFAAPR